MAVSTNAGSWKARGISIVTPAARKTTALVIAAQTFQKTSTSSRFARCARRVSSARSAIAPLAVAKIPEQLKFTAITYAPYASATVASTSYSGASIVRSTVQPIAPHAAPMTTPPTIPATAEITGRRQARARTGDGAQRDAVERDRDAVVGQRLRFDQRLDTGRCAETAEHRDDRQRVGRGEHRAEHQRRGRDEAAERRRRGCDGQRAQHRAGKRQQRERAASCGRSATSSMFQAASKTSGGRNTKSNAGPKSNGNRTWNSAAATAPTATSITAGAIRTRSATIATASAQAISVTNPATLAERSVVRG